MFYCEYCEIFKNTFLWNTSGGCFWNQKVIWEVRLFDASKLLGLLSCKALTWFAPKGKI